MTEPESFDTATSNPVCLARASQADHEEILSLKLHEHQIYYVASNRASLAEADENPACTPLVIRSDGVAVGFAMYALDEDDGNYWIYRLMIDARFQGRGYGGAALAQLLAMLAELPDCSCVILGVNPDNERARRLYERAGFTLTGDVIDGELVMSYEF